MGDAVKLWLFGVLMLNGSVGMAIFEATGKGAYGWAAFFALCSLTLSRGYPGLKA